MKIRIWTLGLFLIFTLLVVASCELSPNLRAMNDEEKLAYFAEQTADLQRNGYCQNGTLTYTRKLSSESGTDTLVRNEAFSYTLLLSEDRIRGYQSDRRSAVMVGGRETDVSRVTEGFADGVLYYGSFPSATEAFRVKDICEDAEGVKLRAQGLAFPVLTPDQFETVTVELNENGDGYQVSVRDPLPKTKSLLVTWIRRTAMGYGVDLTAENAKVTLYYDAKGVLVSQSVNLSFEGSEGALRISVKGDVAVSFSDPNASLVPEDCEDYEEAEGLLTVLRAEDTMAKMLTNRDLEFELTADFLLRDEKYKETLQKDREWNAIRYGLWSVSFRYNIEYEITRSGGPTVTTQKGKITYDGKKQTVTPQKGQGSESSQSIRQAKQYMASVLSPLAFDVRELSGFTVTEHFDGTTKITMDFAVPGRATTILDGIMFGEKPVVYEATRRLTITLSEEGDIVGAVLSMTAKATVDEYPLSASNTLTVTNIKT